MGRLSSFKSMAPRLTTLKPKLSTLAPRIGLAPAATRQGQEANRLREREKNTPNRKWYHSKRWKDLRIEVLKRDNWTCQQTGVICTGNHPEPNSPVADHRKPHHWDPILFWDIDNIQTVTKTYHDSQKQKQERAQPGW